MKSRSKYRIILMVAGVLHLIAFFLLPYAQLKGVAGGLGDVAKAFGMGDMYPKNLTAFNAVRCATSMLGQEEGKLVAFSMVFPVIMGLIVLLMNFFGKGRLSYIMSIVVSLLALSSYAIVKVGMQDYSARGYSVGFGTTLMVILCLAQSVIAVVGCVADKGGVADKGSVAFQGKAGGKSVKVGKKDGKITGLRGSYAGAEIPVKGGEAVVIGRDPSVCSIVLKDEKASRKHCEIVYNAGNGMYSVRDYSANGTYGSDGSRLPEKTAVPMSAGSEIRIGKDGDVFRLG